MAKKKILLMSDDLRMHSGVATVSKDIVFETLNEYDWVQIGGAINHPEKGKIIEQGTHIQLLKKKGLYADMWNTQQTIEKAEETLQNIKPEYKKLLRK